MEFFTDILSFIIYIDIHLAEIIADYGTLSYAILFLIIFAETGLVFTPFLPGDSLLFAAGAFSAVGFFNIAVLSFLLFAAAFLGDTVNYWIGHFFGYKIIENKKIFVNQKHIERTWDFFGKHGKKTIFLARFIPIVRTFAPFLAGMAKMDYKKFIYYNISGGFVWVFSFLFLGYFFGNLPAVKDNFSAIVLAIIAVSFSPVFFEFARSRIKKRQNKTGIKNCTP